jgi:hypothetical protein
MAVARLILGLRLVSLPFLRFRLFPSLVPEKATKRAMSCYESRVGLIDGLIIVNVPLGQQALSNEHWDATRVVNLDLPTSIALPLTALLQAFVFNI